ncbi:preprotein translocase subunit YajC [Intestinimonas sp. MSJ-38]|uniref:preprotein translocase subunit YajC n=1 Tax=Intestinimonas sp. MSJ-38 TaxID=2841532 RepID=UPI000E47D706|nr:preprotein translocase subunit YajC [Intestinimonas sp. MSJ-38]MBU5433541.1 preprotein translocase subunit YajC [Intestinimonas sp. MSJ-38]RHT68566.1 preprotein translocase subunit YajC [Ruminococcaceae bacterium AM28-23LB]
MEWTAYIWIVATFAIFYLLLIRPQQKREKKERIMRNSLEAGDHIVTIGGIVGKIISVKEDEIVIETGADRTKLTMKKWCVQAKENGEEKE